MSNKTAVKVELTGSGRNKRDAGTEVVASWVMRLARL